ncbi:MAG: CHAD domain-containing protein [Candidatus Eisenbacteria bacterium]
MSASPDAPLSPAASPPPALLQAALDFSARLLTLETAAQRIRHREDAEAIHDFRVAARRLTASLDLWSPLLDPEAALRTRRRVRNLRRRLSVTRDLEVIGAFLRERIATAHADARIVLEARIARIECRLANQTRRAPGLVTRRRLEKVRRGLLAAVRRAPAPLESANASSLAQQRIAATRELALWALNAAWARRDDESLHQARVRIKAWRDAREIAEAFPALVSPPDDPAPAAVPSVRELRSIQDALGTVQDLSIATGDLERQARRARKNRLPALAATLDTLIKAALAEKQAAVVEAQRRATTLSVAALRDRAAGA